MPDDLMRYDLLAQNALKGVVREALRIAETTGLPGEHHFYIAFNTRHPGVSLSEKIAARYPREMTIVLQHQYWNLRVYDDRFEVELSFDNVQERLLIPFDAVKGFLDPAVQFGLQFETVSTERKPREVEAPKPSKSKRETAPEPATKTPESSAQGEAEKVVSLDQFRKK
jgi:uncharacterized protein